MKIYITIKGTATKSGYVNINPVANQSGFVKADVRNLNDFVSDNECTEILIDNVLSFLEKRQALQAIDHWISKLRHGGKIIIKDIDSLEISRNFVSSTINDEQYEELVHGKFTQPWDVKLSSYTLESISNQLSSRNLRLTKKRIRGFDLVVEGTRQ